jgi:hypothetical protein
MAQTYALPRRGGPSSKHAPTVTAPGAATASGKAGYSGTFAPGAATSTGGTRPGGCGARWMPDDPDWLAQRLPDD